jgi:anti-sigma factor RsiW
VTCRELVEFLSEYLSGELAATERAEFEAHLAECPACVAYLDTYGKTIQLLKAAFARSEDQLPDRMPEQVVQAILAARKKGTQLCAALNRAHYEHADHRPLIRNRKPKML